MADTNTYNSFQKVEKWTTKEKFNALDLSTIETGTEYNLAGPIDETDLGSDLQTKINGKLTKPTNPSEESAVTLLADGTVGTKPLSEIGGGGGKLYLHRIVISQSGLNITFNIYCSKNTKLTKSELNDFNPGIASFSSESDNGALAMDITYNQESDILNIALFGVANSGGTAMGYNNNFANPTYTDTYTEV